MIHTVGEKIEFIRSVFGTVDVSRDSRNVAIVCPICDPTDRSKRKLVIRTDDDANHCWVCGWKARTLAPLLRKYAKHRLREYCERFSKRSSFNVDIDDSEKPDDEIKLPIGFRLLATARNGDAAAALAKRYVLGRGLTEQDLWRYKFGVCDDATYHERVIVPSFAADGSLNYYVARSIRNVKPKYKNPSVPASQIVFDELNIDWKEQLVVCEGVFDYVKCGDNATPLLGSNVDEENELFNMIVLHGTPIVVALDDDVAKKRDVFVKKLLDYDIDVRLIDLAGYHDPGSMSKEVFFERRLQAKPWNWNSSFFERLATASKTKLKLRNRRSF